MSDPQSHQASSSEPRSTWREVCLNVQKEKGVEQITHAVTDAEDAICQRWQELSKLPGHADEREELRQSADRLLQIKIGKLGWPSV